MTVSKFFSGHIARESEQDLHESLVIENIQLFGQDIAYIPLEEFDVDTIIRDPKNIVFKKFHIIEGYFPLNAQEDGVADIMSKFGYRDERRNTVLISKKRFREVTGKNRPMEGDLILVSQSYDNIELKNFQNHLYEINDVDHQEPEWAHGKNYTFKIEMQRWIANNEKFDTGNFLIDKFDSNAPQNNLMPNRTDSEDVKKEEKEVVAFDKNNPLSGI